MQQASQQAYPALRLPLPIEHLAATYALGAPHTKYRTKNEKVMAFLAILYMLYLIILVSAIFFIFISDTQKTWFVWLVWLFFTLTFAICIWLFTSMLAAPRIEVFVCPAGLIYSKKNLLEAIRWDQVEAYWQDISISHDSDTSDTYKYSVQRNDGAKFEFPDEIADIKQLGELIVQQVERYLLPRTIAAYYAGIPITFGDIIVKQQEISVDRSRKLLAWNEIESLNLTEETIDIYRKGNESAWHHQRIAQIASPGVLRGLMNHIIEERAHQQLSQVIAAYNAGSPIVFGRLGLSLQGITIDNGKKTLSWNEVKMINVDVQKREVSISIHTKLLSWQTLRTWMTPDVLVLKGLVDYALRAYRQNVEARLLIQWPQALASFNAGTPLTFGRVSFSLQGIEIDGGRQFLPRHDVSRMYIGSYFGGERLTIAKKGKALAWQTIPVAELGDVDLLQKLIEYLMSNRP